MRTNFSPGAPASANIDLACSEAAKVDSSANHVNSAGVRGSADNPAAAVN